ncbi:MAG: RsmD family RNA methyltransferase [Bacteroidales bacterium]|nr:RsmD family RNA methyltransferase [Bacteroidales bacterium]
MRIIGGKFGGRYIPLPNSLPVKPTTAVAREGLFNILQHRYDISNTIVFDLYAGTGSISLEFISRGANKVFAVEKNPLLVRHLKKIKKEWNLNNFYVTFKDVHFFLRFTKLKADIIFADPYYHDRYLEEIIQYVFERQLLMKDGILIVEHSKEKNFYKHPNFIEERKYGKVHFSLFMNKDI